MSNWTIVDTIYSSNKKIGNRITDNLRIELIQIFVMKNKLCDFVVMSQMGEKKSCFRHGCTFNWEFS